jgi:hypothetical protein
MELDHEEEFVYTDPKNDLVEKAELQDTNPFIAAPTDNQKKWRPFYGTRQSSHYYENPHRGQPVGGPPFWRHAANTCIGVENTAAPPL